MSQTDIPAGSPLARQIFSPMLFARTIEAKSFLSKNSGPAPKQSDAEAKMKGQTPPGYPVVRVTDLSQTAGGSISVDAFDTSNGKPIMGDRNAEGKGEKLSSSTMLVKIDVTTKVFDAGGKMAQQRTLHNLRGMCMAQMEGWFPRQQSQTAMVHLAGARGSQVGKDWIVPLASDADFNDILINPVVAPTYNRHYVIDGATLTQGGAQLGSIVSTDVWTLDNIDAISLLLDDQNIPLQYVAVADDPLADEDPIKGILYLTPKQMNQLTTQNSGRNWSDMVKYAWVRKSAGTKNPLFTGEVGMWKGVLVRQQPRAVIRFAIGESVNIVTAANRYTATETTQAVNAALTAGYAVERAVLLGAQALANVYGRNQSSDYYFNWSERKYNFEKNLEVAGDCMGGMAKLRFTFDDGAGNKEPTDIGCMVFDSAVKL